MRGGAVAAVCLGEFRPYRMADVRRARGTNGLLAASLFSGAGGGCLGLELAGFEVVFANEFVEAAAEVYRLNHPGVNLDPRDVRELSAADVLAGGKVDLLEGSPPCSSFSLAGSREKRWGQVVPYSETAQRTDDLFFEFARILRGVRPRAFVAENVLGLVAGAAKGYFKTILRELARCGYRVEARAINASWLGVPQSRSRIFFVGFREDLELDPVFPLPLPDRVSLGAAIFGMPTPPADGPEWLGPSAVGREWDRLRPGEQSRRYFNLVRPDPALPCPTVTAVGGSAPGTACVTHPTERRKFSIAELRRVSGFPDDFELRGTYAQQWERLGRSVCPPVMRAIGETIARELALCAG